MKLFIDNDIILKISSISAWPEVEKTFGVTRDSFYVLPTAKYYIKRSKTVKENYSEEVIKCALEFIATCHEITEQQINKDEIDSLSEVLNIDAGEQILFSVKDIKDFLILTGDKKAIIQLNFANQVIKKKLEQKIVCLEKLLLEILRNNDFDIIQNKIKSNYCSNDKVVKIAFTQSGLSVDKVNECLSSYYQDLKSKSNQLLYLLILIYLITNN
jgi:hypothetical protein